MTTFMPSTALVAAILSDVVYHSTGDQINTDALGWVPVIDPATNQPLTYYDKVSGYYGEAWGKAVYDANGNIIPGQYAQIMQISRGTVFTPAGFDTTAPSIKLADTSSSDTLSTLFDDAADVLTGTPPVSYIGAATALYGMIEAKYPNLSLLETGQSLGGLTAAAIVAANFTQNPTLSAITFNELPYTSRESGLTPDQTTFLAANDLIDAHYVGNEVLTQSPPVGTPIGRITILPDVPVDGVALASPIIIHSTGAAIVEELLNTYPLGSADYVAAKAWLYQIYPDQTQTQQVIKDFLAGNNTPSDKEAISLAIENGVYIQSSANSLQIVGKQIEQINYAAGDTPQITTDPTTGNATITISPLEANGLSDKIVITPTNFSLDTGLISFVAQLPNATLSVDGSGTVTITPGASAAGWQGSYAITNDGITYTNNDLQLAFGAGIAGISATPDGSTVFSLKQDAGAAASITVNPVNNQVTLSNVNAANGIQVNQSIVNADGSYTMNFYDPVTGALDQTRTFDRTGTQTSETTNPGITAAKFFSNFIDTIAAQTIAKFLFTHNLPASLLVQALANSQNIAQVQSAVTGGSLNVNLLIENFATKLTSLGGGLLGSDLGADLFRDLGLPIPIGQAVGNVLGSAAAQQLTNYIASDVFGAKNLPSIFNTAIGQTLTIGQFVEQLGINFAAAGINLLASPLEMLIEPNANPTGALIGSFIGSAAGLVAGTAIGAEIGGEIGSLLGPPGTAIGAIIGYLTGGLFGPGTSVGPNGGGQVYYDSNTKSFQVTNVAVDNGGSLQLAAALPGAVIQLLNAVLMDIGGQVDISQGVPVFAVGFYKGQYRALDEINHPGDTEGYLFPTPDAAVDYAVLQMLRQTHIVNGNPYMNYVLATNGSPTAAGLMGDLNVAYSYSQFVADPFDFDAALVASGDTSLFQNWQTSYARALTLGLDHLSVVPGTSNLVFTGSSAYLAANIDSAQGLLNQGAIVGIQSSDSGAVPFVLTIGQAIGDIHALATLPNGFTITISDSFANIMGNLNYLQALVQSGALQAITYTDTGVQNASITDNVLLQNTLALRKIVTTYSETVGVSLGVTETLAGTGNAGNTLSFGGFSGQGIYVNYAAGTANSVSPTASGNYSFSNFQALYGTVGNDVFEFAPGFTSVVVSGGGGNDSYTVEKGAGTVVINNGVPHVGPTGIGTLQFGANVPYQNIMLLQSGNNLLVQVQGDPEQVLFNNWFTVGYDQVASISSYNGVRLTNNDGTLTLYSTASQAVQDATMLSHIPQSAQEIVRDSAQNVSANLAGLEVVAVNGPLTSVVFTDAGVPTISMSVAQLQTYNALFSKFGSYRVAIVDSAANISAKFDLLGALARQGTLASTTPTDSGGWNLQLSVSQMTETDVAALGTLQGVGGLIAFDTSTNILAGYANLKPLAVSGVLNSVVLADSGIILTFANPNIPVATSTLAQYVSNYTFFSQFGAYRVAIVDTAANIQANIDLLGALARQGTLASATPSDPGRPILSITDDQFNADHAALDQIHGAYGLAISGIAAANAQSVANQPNVVLVSIIDSSANVLANINALQSLSDQMLINSISVTDANPAIISQLFGLHNLAIYGVSAANAASVASQPHVFQEGIVDTISNIVPQLSNLETIAKSGKLASVSLTDPNPVVPLTATEFSANIEALGRFANAFAIVITDATTQNIALTAEQQIAYASVLAKISGTYHVVTIADPTAPCFVTGTQILTERGEVPVEDLKVGDQVFSCLSNSFVPIQWIGHRSVNLERHPHPHDVQPICVKAGAFGDALPRQDTWLSPDHAIYDQGVLMPIRYLLNGCTVAQDQRSDVTYWHVELPKHDVLLANGLPSESFLDTGNRGAFANSKEPVQLHPDFAKQVWEKKACADLVLDGAEIIAAKSWLLARAEATGHATTADPGLKIMAVDQGLTPDVVGNQWRIAVPENTKTIRLLSRRWVPAHMDCEATDTRQLGIAISRIWLDGREASLESEGFSSGWHASEGNLRWSNGEALLSLPDAAKEITIEVAKLGRYWSQFSEQAANRSSEARGSTTPIHII